jgi:hypothetical protein
MILSILFLKSDTEEWNKSLVYSGFDVTFSFAFSLLLPINAFYTSPLVNCYVGNWFFHFYLVEKHFLKYHSADRHTALMWYHSYVVLRSSINLVTMNDILCIGKSPNVILRIYILFLSPLVSQCFFLHFSVVFFYRSTCSVWYECDLEWWSSSINI